MNVEKFERAVRKAYVGMGYTQLRGMWFRRSKGEVEYVCPMCAAVVGLGVDVNRFHAKDDDMFYDIMKKEFDMKDEEMNNIIQWNDHEKLPWENILTRIISGWWDYDET